MYVVDASMFLKTQINIQSKVLSSDHKDEICAEWFNIYTDNKFKAG